MGSPSESKKKHLLYLPAQGLGEAAHSGALVESSPNDTAAEKLQHRSTMCKYHRRAHSFVFVQIRRFTAVWAGILQQQDESAGDSRRKSGLP